MIDLTKISAQDYLDGQVLLVEKPLNWTSFDVVNKIRGHLKNRMGFKKIKVGHAGTLDPLASGLLIICIGRATKRIVEFQDFEKGYTGTMVLGATTPSFDLETEVGETYETKHITEELIHQSTKIFTGTIIQRPPIFSAKKVDGKPAYIYARKGEDVEVRTSEIKIYDFKITRISMPELDFEVRCSKGTYIRSLANDFGKELGSGAYLSSLCRTHIGEYLLEDAITIENFVAQVK